MCLETTRKEINDFKEKHKNNEDVTVWKVYLVDKRKKCLTSPYASERPHWNVPESSTSIKTPGIVKSNRKYTRLRSGGYQYSDKYSKNYYKNAYKNSYRWKVGRGMHVFTNRNEAVKYLKHRMRMCNSFRRRGVIVCCKVKMKDYVAANKYGEAVFMEISISPRNLRKAMTKK